MRFPVVDNETLQTDLIRFSLDDACGNMNILKALGGFF